MTPDALYRFDDLFYIDDPELHISFSEPSAGCCVRTVMRDDGTLLLSSTYRDDHLHGPSYGSFANGIRSSEQWFYRGLTHGRSLEYDPSGLMRARHGYVQGRLEGPYLRWHANGKIQLVGNFHHGVPEGVFELFHTDGLLLRSISFMQGRRHGFDSGWTDDGFLLFCEAWKEGVRQRTILPDVLYRSLGLDKINKMPR